MSARTTRPFARSLLLGVLGLAACQSGDGVAPGTEPAVASIELSTSVNALLAGDTLRAAAVARDGRGARIEAAQLDWSGSNPAVLQVLPDGRVVGVGNGVATVRAASNGVSATLTLTVLLTTAERRFAYAFAHDAESRTTYGPMHAFARNATGGEIRVTRRTTGRYTVTFGRLAKVDPTFKEVVVVTAYGSGSERCHLDGWGNAPNGRDLDAQVSCYDALGTPLDSRFTILLVGAGSLPGRHGFAAPESGNMAAGALMANTFSSSGETVGVDRSATGSYLVRLRAPRRDFPENYFISTVGDAPDFCKVSSWNFGDWASVVCYDPTGARVDARFSLLMVEGGRPGKRFGFAWANDPSAPLDQPYSPAAAYQRSSSGEAVRVTHTAQGEYVVDFRGLAHLGSNAEVVQVSPFGSGLTSCQLEGWTGDAQGTLRAHVRCWNRASGAREDGQFTVLVLE